MIRCKRKANGFRGGPRIDEVVRNEFLLLAIVSPESLANLVAMNATRHDLSLPIQFNFVTASETRNVQRRFERNRVALFARQGRFVSWIAAVEGESGFEGALVARGGFVLGVF